MPTSARRPSSCRRPLRGGGRACSSTPASSRPRGESSNGSIDTNTKSASLSLRQNLYAGGGTQAQTSRAENLVQAGRAQLTATEQSVLLDAVQAYTAAWRDLAVLDLALNNEQVLRRQLQQTQDQFTVGEVARTDVAQAEARLSRARADVEQAKAALAASNATYKQVIGQPPRQLADPVRLAELPETLEAAQIIAESNPNVVAATYQLFAARDDVDVAFANLLPSLDLTGDVGYTDEPQASVDWSRSASIGLSLSIPLYQGGAEYSQVRQNRETVQEQREPARVGEPVGAGERDHGLGPAAGRSRGRIDPCATRCAPTRSRFEGVDQEQRVGLRTVIDVLDAGRTCSRRRSISCGRGPWRWCRAISCAPPSVELTVTDLSLPVEPYQPGHLLRPQSRPAVRAGSAVRRPPLTLSGFVPQPAADHDGTAAQLARDMAGFAGDVDQVELASSSSSTVASPVLPGRQVGEVRPPEQPGRRAVTEPARCPAAACRGSGTSTWSPDCRTPARRCTRRARRS